MRKEASSESTQAGAERRSALYRSEGARGRGPATISEEAGAFVAADHRLACTRRRDAKGEDDKITLALRCIDDMRKYINSAGSDRRRFGIVVFCGSKATAKSLERKLGPPVTKKSAKQTKYARRHFKPKGQGRIGGRSLGLQSGVIPAIVYKAKGVGLLHVRSTEAEEEGVCRDLRSGKLHTVLVANSGSIGPGDPLWNQRDYICGVVVFDAPASTQLYDAMASYAGRRPRGSALPRVVTIVSDTNSPIARVLTKHFIELNEGVLETSVSTADAQLSATTRRTTTEDDVTRLRNRVRAFYEAHNPAKLTDVDSAKCLVDQIVERCVNGSVVDREREKRLFAKLHDKYRSDRSTIHDAGRSSA